MELLVLIVIASPGRVVSVMWSDICRWKSWSPSPLWVSLMESVGEDTVALTAMIALRFSMGQMRLMNTMVYGGWWPRSMDLVGA